MGNMSYCRFENTLEDFRDCLDNIDEPCSKDESRARKSLIQLARKLTGWYPDDASVEALPVGAGDDE